MIRSWQSANSFFVSGVLPQDNRGELVLSKTEGNPLGDANLFPNDLRRLDRLFYFAFCVLMSGRDLTLLKGFLRGYKALKMAE